MAWIRVFEWMRVSGGVFSGFFNHLAQAQDLDILAREYAESPEEGLRVMPSAVRRSIIGEESVTAGGPKHLTELEREDHELVATLAEIGR